ncbi:MAG: FadR/GntR family transcriptional regulator [Pseudomonadota bacterium]
MNDAAESRNPEGLAADIAARLRDAIMAGDLASDERLPGEQELAERYGVSRPTVREALKRLAAQNLIRSRRGPTGGTFVNRISWGEAHESLATLSMLVVGMQGADPAEIIEARLALLKTCVPFAVKRRETGHLTRMRAEAAAQRGDGLSDEDFCASDVRFHRALADATGNPVLAFQMAGVVEGMQPLLNMITYRARDREMIADGHEAIADAVEARDGTAAIVALERLAAYVSGLTEGLLVRKEKS